MSHCKKQTLLMSRYFFPEILNFLHKQLCQPITTAVQISIYPESHQKPQQQQQRLTSSSSVSAHWLLLDKQTVTDASENTSWNGLGTVFTLCVFFSRGVGMYSKVLFFPLGKHNENQVSITRGCQFFPSCFVDVFLRGFPIQISVNFGAKSVDHWTFCFWTFYFALSSWLSALLNFLAGQPQCKASLHQILDF